MPGTVSDDRLTTDEREELAQLRRENRRLREDVEILKRATAFFAGWSLWRVVLQSSS